MAAVRPRPGRIAALATAALLALAPVAGADPSIAVQVSAATQGAPMPAGFVGFSFEYQALRAYAGRDPDHVNPVLLGLIRGLAPSGSPSLRIGGNSTDQTWWPMAATAPPGGVTFALTPDWLRVAHALAADLGARMILGVNLAAGRPALAAAEGRALVQGIGRRYLSALEIGNEADLYNSYAWYRTPDGRNISARSPSYSMGDFENEFAAWGAALPRTPLAGPAFAEGSWMQALPALLANEPRLSVVTFHRYPLRGCIGNPTSGIYASIPSLLGDAAAAGLAQQVQGFAVTAHAAGRQFRLDELNSVACAGKRGVSDTFASALWVLDTLFNLRAAGVDGVNIHTLPGAAYQPFSFSRRRSRWVASVKPLYYGLLLFARAFPPGARMLALSAPTGPVKAWATQAPDGHVRVVLINKDPSVGVTVHVELPGGAQDVTAVALRAPALSATTGVTLGGAGFGASTSTGVLPLAPGLPLSPSDGYYTVPLPAGSAVLLTG
jgi:hypothetical protein